MADIMFAGSGGQGALTAGKILTEIAAEKGKNVCWTSEYSAEMRGGYALSRVVISDEDIGTPYPDFLDILCCMDENSYRKYAGTVRPGGYILINTSLFSAGSTPDDVHVYGVEATGLATELENSRGANLVLLGAMVHATQLLPENEFGATLEEYFEKKGKGVAKNVQCFRIGCEKLTGC